MAMEEGAGTSAIPKEEDGTLVEAWARQAGVTPEGQRDNPEAVWTRGAGRLGRCAALQEPAAPEGVWGPVPGKWRG